MGALRIGLFIDARAHRPLAVYRSVALYGRIIFQFQTQTRPMSMCRLRSEPLLSIRLT